MITVPFHTSAALPLLYVLRNNHGFFGSRETTRYGLSLETDFYHAGLFQMDLYPDAGLAERA